MPMSGCSVTLVAAFNVMTAQTLPPFAGAARELYVKPLHLALPIIVVEIFEYSCQATLSVYQEHVWFVR